MIVLRLRRALLVTLLVSLVVVFGPTPSTAAPGDLDDDTVPDSVDIDDDNDGIPDALEGYSCTPSTLTAYAQNFDSYAPWRVAPASPTGSVLPIVSDGDNWWSRTGGTVSDQSVNAASAFFLPGDLKGLATSDIILWLGDTPATDMDYLFVSKPIAVTASTSYVINIDNAADNSAPIPAFELFISTDNGATWGPGTSLPHSTTFQTNTINYTTGAETSLVLRVGNSTAGSNGNDGGINNVVVTTPSETCSGIDTDGDSIEDHRDLDSDNDGISDLAESTGTPDPLTDPDHNGVIDGAAFVDANSDGLADAVAPGTTPINSDASDVADFRDLDSDNDGIPDAVEAQPTTGYTAAFDYSGATDLDGDGVLSIFDGGVTFGGTFSVPVDTDSLAGADYRDTDSDEDSLLDSAEAGTAATGVTYADPNGSINDPTTDLANQFGDTTEVAYREVPNVAPVAANDSLSGLTVGTTAALNLLTNDTDSDGSLVPGTVQIINAGVTNGGRTLIVPDEGTWTVNPTTGAISFAPLSVFISDPTDIAYRVEDNVGSLSNTATISLDYDGIPDAVNDAVSTTRDSVDFLISWSTNDFLADNAVLESVDPTSTAGGTVTIDSIGVLAYTPAAGYVGSDSFQYAICDDDLPTPTCDTATITISVAAPTYEVAGRAFLDANRDGVLDPGEADLPTITVRLYTAGPDLMLGTLDDVEVQSTQASGPYTFAGVGEGTYLLVIDSSTTPTGVWATNNTPTYGTGTAEITVLGSDVATNPMGYFYAAVRGILTDATGNPEPNATITIVDSDQNSFTTTTDAAGAYLFQGGASEALATGSVTVSVETNDGRTAIAVVTVGSADLVIADLGLNVAQTTTTSSSTTTTTTGPTTTTAAQTTTTSVVTTTTAPRAQLPVTGSSTAGTLRLSLLLVLCGTLLVFLKESARLIPLRQWFDGQGY